MSIASVPMTALAIAPAGLTGQVQWNNNGVLAGSSGLVLSATQVTSLTLAAPLAITQGGTGATAAPAARTNLGLGSMALQNNTSVYIIGGEMSIQTMALSGKPGDNMVALYLDVSSAGGTNRQAINSVGDAPIYLNGNVAVGNATLVVLAATGFVGIRTWEPVYPLEVNGTSAFWGKMGIGRIPSGGTELLAVESGAFFNGGLWTTANSFKPGGGPWGDTSSVQFKTAIMPLTGALALLLAQQGVRFVWDRDPHRTQLPGVQYGLIAEQVTIPQWQEIDRDGNPALCLRGFEALTIEALREVVQRLEALEEQRV